VTRTVRDSAALLDATHGMQLGSRYTAPTPERPFLQEVGRDPGKLRIALALTPAGGTPVDPEVVAAARAAARLCESLGHHVEEAAPKLDLAALGRAAFAIIPTAIAAEVAERQAQTGIAPGPEVLEKVTLLYREMGLKTTGVERENAEYILQATAVQVADFMQSYDLILSPTLAAPPLRLGLLGLSPADVKTYFDNVTQFTPFTGLFNQTGQPSMSAPLGMSKDGLPIGVMFSARYGEEATLLRLAGQLEAAAPWGARRPKAA
jgi:Asp-tRNA(Asn)/Glu-tRNA(Gln) amidotransferase A subunit family amidase